MEHSNTSNWDQKQMHVIIELLNVTQGTEFAVLSRDTITNQPRATEGMLRHASGQGVRVIHKAALFQTFTQDEFLTDSKVQAILFNAFLSGDLGVKTEPRRYAFNPARIREIEQIQKRNFKVIDSAQELKGSEEPNEDNSVNEEFDQEITFDTISEELYQTLLEQFSLMRKSFNGAIPVKAKESDNHSFKPNLTVSSKKTSAKSTRQSPITPSSKTQQKKLEEVSYDRSRAQERNEVEKAKNKDRIASDKLRRYISSEQLKAEIKNSTALQNLIGKGELNEASLIKMLEKAEITEANFFKLLDLAEINESLFMQLLKDIEINNK